MGTVASSARAPMRVPVTANQHQQQHQQQPQYVSAARATHRMALGSPPPALVSHSEESMDLLQHPLLFQEHDDGSELSHLSRPVNVALTMEGNYRHLSAFSDSELVGQSHPRLPSMEPETEPTGPLSWARYSVFMVAAAAFAGGLVAGSRVANVMTGL
eukprot:TRINITY_DN5261_c0_g1_i1.p1 TRINITY_DN5261_c0_g1~~TRINITY_DN5261_c0_g1_i1.p1  ORF type:complete len:158 (+),score=29.16 TRINITY_DN5261_c0_g1_i1:96-569(+)